MHPDDEREYMDEISGFTRQDDINERYHRELEDMKNEGRYDYEDEQEEEDGPNYVYVEHEDDGWITDQFEEDHECPF